MSKSNKKVDPSIIRLYKPEDDFIVYHEDDPDLDVIKVPLPKTPPWEEIDGYGLPAHEQKFQRCPLPAKIVDLQKQQNEDNAFLTQDEMWDIIGSDPDYYKNEIAYIATQWRRRIEGYWFFNNGKATYIDGWNYVYLNFWELDTGLPEYRDRDRKFFLFARFCHKDNKSLGFVYPKHRREGATSKACCVNYCITSMLNRAHSGIQSMTEGHAETVYQKHIIDPWKTGMPFFFKPNHDGGDDPKGKLAFRPTSNRGKKGAKSKSDKSLLSSITYKPSNTKAYDTWKLYFYHSDECGKTEEVDINERWRIVRLCLAQGAGGSIHGLSIHTSTVGNLSKGGENFRKLCRASMYSQRPRNGQTISGLYICFIPAWEGLDWYVDEYGMSVIDTPTKEQRIYLENRINPENGERGCPDPTIGAREYIENTVKALEAGDDYSEYAEFMRQHPTRFRGCFINSETQSDFNLMKINRRIDELRSMPDATVRGNFELINEQMGFTGGVKFTPNPKGKFRLSKVLAPEEANNLSFDGQTYRAQNLQYCAGGDPFKANKTKGTKKSNGGGAVFWGHDIFLDPMNKPMSEWKSKRFICTYNHRPPTKEEYGNDMIMMCMYFGCPMFPEVDVPFLREHFEEKGFGGLLVFKYENSKFDAVAGVTANKHKQKIFLEYIDYIEFHVERENHVELLEEVRDIEDVDDMTNWDLFTAGGYAMLGIKNYFPQMQKESTMAGNDISAYLEEFTA